MELFRDHGYAGTSTQMLVEGLGVNRYSLYAEFGSKQALFDATPEYIGRRTGADLAVGFRPVAAGMQVHHQGDGELERAGAVRLDGRHELGRTEIARLQQPRDGVQRHHALTDRPEGCVYPGLVVHGPPTAAIPCSGSRG